MLVGARARAQVEARAQAVAAVVRASVLVGVMALGGRSCKKEPRVTVASCEVMLAEWAKRLHHHHEDWTAPHGPRTQGIPLAFAWS